MLTKTINARDFPIILGEEIESGEKFKEEVLVPALKEYDLIVLYLRDVEGCTHDFLKGAFGGLEEYGLTQARVLIKLLIDADDVVVKEIYDIIISDLGLLIGELLYLISSPSTPERERAIVKNMLTAYKDVYAD